MMKKQKIFITGASSFLGKKLINTLQESHEISILIHKKNIEEHLKNNINIINGSIENISEWEKNLSDIDIIIHFAAITHTKNLNLYDKINNLGTQKLIESAKNHNIKQFIFISTRAIGNCCGAYGASKESAEICLKNSKLVYTILRTSEVYDSDFSRAEGLGNIVYLIKKSLLIPYPYGKQTTLAPIHINDVQNIIIATIDNSVAYNKTYVVAGPENLFLKEIMERICKKEKLKRIFIPIPIIFIRLAFFIFSKILNKGTPDQLDRLLCQKAPLSKNTIEDFKITPRDFLIF